MTNVRPLRPGERPPCDQTAWRLVLAGPVPVMVFMAELAAEGASSEDIAKAVRLLELVALDGVIGHAMDLGRQQTEFGVVGSYRPPPGRVA